MKFVKIEYLGQVFPGEYLYHQPSQQMVLCGRLNFDENTIKVKGKDGMVTGPMSDFLKISLTQEEIKQKNATRCKGCSGR